MTIKEISCASFEAKPVNENLYQVIIHFLDQNGEQISDQLFTFSQHDKVHEASIFDIYSQNGTCIKGSPNAKLKHIFRKSDAEAIKAALQHIPNSSETLFVLDLKDQHTGYLDCQECHRRYCKM